MTKQWNVCAGDPSWVDVPDLAKPINCFSRARAKLIVDAVNAYLAPDEPSGDPAQELIAARLILEQVKYSEETKTHLPHSILTGIRAWLKRNEAYRRALRAENRSENSL